MSRIVLGKSGDKNVELKLDVLLRTHLLIWASTGGGSGSKKEVLGARG